MRHRLLEFLREHTRFERYRILKPLHSRSQDAALWTFRREPVARGVAVGFFFGILIPVAQFVFAIVAAVVLRANVLAAAGSTLITNPFILPFVYYAAYRIGEVITGRSAEPEAVVEAEVEALEEAAEHALDLADWVPTLTNWATTIGFPLLIGILSLAVTAALIGYALVHVAWAAADRFRNVR